MHKLDIVIPCLNEYANLSKLLPYVLEHSPKGMVNLMVVDSKNSSDSTQSLCKSLNIEYLLANKTQRSSQLNQGANFGKAPFIMFLHADVLPPKTYFEDIIKALYSEYDAGVFAYNFNTKNPLFKINAFATRYDGVFAGGGDQIHFMKREIFNEMGGYDDAYVLMEDFNFYHRLKKENKRIAIVQNCALVSTRKYKRNPFLLVHVVNLYVFACYYLKVPPKKLKAIYTKWLK